MKLRITQSVKNKKVKILLETIEFSQKENQILDQLGEPLITLEKAYGANMIKITDRKIRSGFKPKVEFDGNLEKSMEACAEQIDKFKEDIQNLLVETMDKLSDDYSSDLAVTTETVEISNIK